VEEGESSRPDPGVHLVLSFLPDGGVETRGTIHYQDDTTSTLLVVNQADTTSACADSDDDGNAGVTFLQIVGRDPRTAAQTVVTFVPAAGEIDERGAHEVRIEIGNRVVPGIVTILPIPATPLDTGPER